MFWADQTAVLERVARGHRLGEVLNDIVKMIERQAEGMLCSILLLDDARKVVRNGAAPTLPPAYAKALDGLPIGPNAGSCGTAAYRGQRVIVEDIATDPLWEAYRQLALPHGLRACWSSPIFSAEREVLGTFAMYYLVPRGPTDAELGWVDIATHLAAIAVESTRRTAALRQSEERLRSVIEHTPDVAIQWYDEAGRITFHNEASARLFGWNGQEALGKSLVELGFWAAAEEARFAEARAQAAAGTRVAPTEFHFKRPDGTDGHLLSTVFQIPMSESERCYVCMDVDLTEHHRMEAAVRAGEAIRALVYDSVSDVIFYLAVEGDGRYRFQSVNRAFLEATGLRDADVVGRLVDEVIPAGSLPLVKSRYAEAIRTRGRVVWEEVSHYPSGTKYGEVTVSPIVDADGAVRYLVGTVHDVTQRREAERERQELETQLHQADRLQALGTLSGGIAHDFNNILAAIHVNVDLVLMSPDIADDSRETLKDVKQAARRATSMVRQILTFGRKSEPRVERIELQPVVKEVLQLLGVAIKGNVELTMTFADDVPPIDGDSTQVHQALVNLVTNAAQAIGGQPGVVAVRVDRYVAAPGARSDAPELREGSYARLTVSDNGPGMDAKTLRRVFEPFFTTKAAGVGTGLGLSVVHGIMKGHGGVVAVHSEVGKGTTFELLFPAAVGARPPRARPPVESPARRILFVDDDEAIVFLARRAFSRLGHGIVAHSSATEALEEFQRRPAEFDVVVTDINMPDFGGAAMVQALRRIRPDVRVVMTAGVVRPDDVALAESLGVVQLLEKPQSLDDLAQLIQIGV